MAFFGAVGAALAYFVIAFAIGYLIIMVYDIVTPTFELWKEVEKGNLAVALSIGGQIIGAGIVLWSAIIHNGMRDYAMLWTIIWALIGGALQVFGFLVFELMTRRLAVERALAADNRAVGFVALAIAISLGIIVAACIS